MIQQNHGHRWNELEFCPNIRTLEDYLEVPGSLGGWRRRRVWYWYWRWRRLQEFHARLRKAYELDGGWSSHGIIQLIWNERAGTQGLFQAWVGLGVIYLEFQLRGHPCCQRHNCSHRSNYVLLSNLLRQVLGKYGYLDWSLFRGGCQNRVSGPQSPTNTAAPCLCDLLSFNSFIVINNLYNLVPSANSILKIIYFILNFFDISFRLVFVDNILLMQLKMVII